MDACLKTPWTDFSGDPGLLTASLRGCGDDYQPTGDHRRDHREQNRPRSRRHLRRLQVLDLSTPGPLSPRGRGCVRAPSATTQDRPDRDTGRDRRPHHRATRETHRDRSGRGPGHDPLAPRTPARHHRLPGHHRPLPGQDRAGHPGAEEEAQVLLHPLPGRNAQRNLAGRLHPLSDRLCPFGGEDAGAEQVEDRQHAATGGPAAVLDDPEVHPPRG